MMQPMNGNRRYARVHWRLLLTLMVVVILYILICAGIFFYLEKSVREKNGTLKEKVINTFLDRHKCSTREETTALLNLFAKEIYLNRGQQFYNKDNVTGNDTSRPWAFGTSVYFVVTVITTIGYGDVYPLTPEGRAFCCVFALVGIPLCLVLLVNVGGGLYILIKRLDDRVDCLKLHPRRAKAVRSAGLFAFGLIIFVLLPAPMLTYVEGWSYAVSVYYAFITLSTIGLGDYVAGQGDSWYLICLVVWLFLGLAWLSTIINCTQELINELLRTEGRIRTSNINRKGRYNAQQLMERSDQHQGAYKTLSGRSLDKCDGLSLDATDRANRASLVSVISTTPTCQTTAETDDFTSITDIDAGNTGVYRAKLNSDDNIGASLRARSHAKWPSEERIMSIDSLENIPTAKTPNTGSIPHVPSTPGDIILSASSLLNRGAYDLKPVCYDKGVQVGMALHTGGSNALNRAGIATIYPRVEQDRAPIVESSTTSDELPGNAHTSALWGEDLGDALTDRRVKLSPQRDLPGRDDTASFNLRADSPFNDSSYADRNSKDPSLYHDKLQAFEGSDTEGRFRRLWWQLVGEDTRRHEGHYNGERSTSNPESRLNTHVGSFRGTTVSAISDGNESVILTAKLNGIPKDMSIQTQRHLGGSPWP